MKKSLNQNDDDYKNYISSKLLKTLNENAKVGEKVTKEIFLSVLDDYFSKKISLGFLSSVANHLYYTLNEPFEVETTFRRDLVNALSGATELDFYFSDTENEDSSSRIYKFIIKQLREYYDENKR